MSAKCGGCGRFIPSGDMVHSDGRARYYFEPLSEFGPEVSYWLCGDCADKEQRIAPCGTRPEGQDGEAGLVRSTSDAVTAKPAGAQGGDA